MLFLCPDTPTGKWSERQLAAQQLLNAHGVQVKIVEAPQSVETVKGSPSSSDTATLSDVKEKSGTQTPVVDVERGSISITPAEEIHLSEQEMLEVARGEIVVAPTFKEGLHVFFSLQTLFHCATYFCSFGGELAINSYLGSYYLKNFPHLGQTGSGRWASMFGLLNIVTRSVHPVKSYSIC